MAIKDLDFLSPKITLYYYGSKRHKSLVGSIMTLIMVIISFIYIFYLFYSIITHKISDFMFYKTYLTDAGEFIFNDTTGIYHYFQIYDIINQEFGQFDQKYIRIFMSRLYKTYQNNQSLLSENEHWVYGKCRDGEDNKNINKDILKEETFFYKGACLRYYYNKEKKEYISIEDKENFKSPYLIHGSSHPGNLFLETIIEKCDNSSIIKNVLGPCGTEEEIQNYLNNYKGIFLQLLEKQVTTDNYEKPILEYFSSIAGALDPLSVPVNNINIAPFYIDIKTGLLLPREQKVITYIFEDNRREYWENNGNKNILAIFDYWLQNSSQIIKGGYSTVYDILPSIGGIIQLIYYIFYSFNFLYNKYIIIQDCNKSFFRMYNSEDKQNIKVNRQFLKNIRSIREEVKHKNEHHFKRHSLYNINKDINPLKNKKNKLKSVKTEIYNNKYFPKLLNFNKGIINMSNSNDLMISLPNNNIIYNNTNNIKIFNNKKRLSLSRNKIYENNIKKKDDIRSIYNYESDKTNNIYFKFSHYLKEFLNHKKKNFKLEPLNEKIVNKYISFLNYIMSFLGNEHRKRGFAVLTRFREKLLGEEHLFRTNIYLYHLEKYFNIKETEKIDIYELYENL